MKMRQITIEVDTHGTTDWMDDHNVTGDKVAFVIETALSKIKGIGHATVTVTKEQEYSL